MFEALLLLGVILLAPVGPSSVVLTVLAIVIIIPGMYATWTGAPFVPTSKKLVRRMLELAQIAPGQKVYDLGCGDGRMVFAAAEKGANAVGYEFSVPTFLVAKLLSLFHPRSRIELRDFWKANYRDADVILCYLLTDSMQTFKRIVWPQLKPGCKVISHNFSMHGIEPTHREEGVVMYIK